MTLKPLIAALGCAASFAAGPVLAQQFRYDGAIGSQPLRATAAVNLVFDVNPGGIPWVIRTFRADIKPAPPAGRGTAGARINARGEGMLLGGGNNVGGRGGTARRPVACSAGPARGRAIRGPRGPAIRAVAAALTGGGGWNSMLGPTVCGSGGTGRRTRFRF